MTKNQKRDIATSLTTMVFLVVGITGVLMFFHLFDNYTKELHEILGLGFIAVVIFHIIFNWNSMKNYFFKKVFGISAAIVLIVTIGFVLNAPDGTNPKKAMIESILNAPIESSVVILGTDKDLAFAKLEEKGIKVDNMKSIKDISKGNKTSPFKIVDIILNK